MIDDSLASDVAKVLRGTHCIRNIEIPGREYDLINKLLAEKILLEDADPNAVLVRRRFRVCTGHFLEVEMYNPKGPEETPSVAFCLMGTPPGAEEDDDGWLLEMVRENDEIPDEILFQHADEEERKILLRILRKD